MDSLFSSTIEGTALGQILPFRVVNTKPQLQKAVMDEHSHFFKQYYFFGYPDLSLVLSYLSFSVDLTLLTFLIDLKPAMILRISHG